MDQDQPTDSQFVTPEPAPTDRVPTPAPVAGAAVAISGPAAFPAQQRRTARLINLALGGALVLAIAGIAFAAGRMTAPASATTITGGNGFPGGGVFNGNGGARPGYFGDGNGRGTILGGGGPSIEGTVESITDTTLTVKTADGQTIQIALEGTTTYHAQTNASSDDVKAGGKVLVRIGFRGAGGSGAAGGAGLSASDVTVVP